MTDLATLDIRIRSLEVDRAQKRLDGLDKSGLRAERTTSKLDKSARRLDRSAGGLSGTLGGLSGILAGIAAAGGVRGAVGVLTEFEDGLVGISKTTGIAGDGLGRIESAIEGLATNSSAPIASLFGIAEAAGQLGIQGERNIIQFTDAVAKLTDAAPSLRGSADDTALSLAKLLAVTGESTDNVGALASSIALLGDSFPTLESKILATGLEIGKAGAAFGVSSAQAVGLAAAFDSIGTEAELSRSAVVQVFGAINKAVASGGDELERFAEIAGTDSDAFAALFDTNAVAASKAFIAGLGELGAQGERTSLVLEDLGLSSKRLQPTLLTLAKNSDLLGDALGAAGDEFANPTKLLREFEAGSDRLGAAFGRLSNTTKVLVDNFADDSTGLAGGLREVVEFSTDVLRVLSGLDGDIRGSADAARLGAASFAGLAAAVGGAATAFGALGAASAVASLATPQGALLGVAAAAGAAAAAVYVYRDSLVEVGDESVRLGDLVPSLFEELEATARGLLGALGPIASDAFSSITASASRELGLTGAAFTGFFDGTAASALKFGDAIAAAVIGPLVAIPSVLGDLKRIVEITGQIRENPLSGGNVDLLSELNDIVQGFDVEGDGLAGAVQKGVADVYEKGLVSGAAEGAQKAAQGVQVAIGQALEQARRDQVVGQAQGQGFLVAADFLFGFESGLDRGVDVRDLLDGFGDRVQGRVSGREAARAAEESGRLDAALEPLLPTLADVTAGAAKLALGYGALADAASDAASATGAAASGGGVAPLEFDVGPALQQITDLDFALANALEPDEEVRKASAIRDLRRELDFLGLSANETDAALAVFGERLDDLNQLDRIRNVSREFATEFGRGIKGLITDIDDLEGGIRNLALAISDVALDRFVIDPIVEGTAGLFSGVGQDLAGLGGSEGTQEGETVAEIGSALAGSLAAPAGALTASGGTLSAAASALLAAAFALQTGASVGQIGAIAGVGAQAAGGAAGSIFGFAKGGAFPGNVKRFASGGSSGGLRGALGDFIEEPTTFPLGLAGEAGEEAIMPGSRRGGAFNVSAVLGGKRLDVPLTRDARGDLAVDLGSKAGLEALGALRGDRPRRFEAGGAFSMGGSAFVGPGGLGGPRGRADGQPEQRGGDTYNFSYNITTQDADSFRRSRRQIEQDARKSISDNPRRRR